MERKEKMWEDIQICMYKVEKYLSNTYSVLDTRSRIFWSFQRSFFKVALQETIAQTDYAGKCQPKEGGYFNQRYEN